MSKELPYFKFEPNEWLVGNIQICSLEEKGAFIDLCCLYWSRLGELAEKLAIVKIGRDNLEALILEEIVSVNNGNIEISFLDNQLEDFGQKSKTAAENAKSRWKETPERIQGQLTYVIRCWGNGEEFVKIGETSNSINRRFSGKMPYKYEAIIVDLDSDTSIEEQYNANANGREYTPKIKFSGSLECYSLDVLGDLIAFAKIRNAKFVRNYAIRGEEIRGDKIREKNIPLIENFLEYAKEKKPNVDEESVRLKFDAWVENDWKDGNDKKIKNWKAKLNNTLPFLKESSRPGANGDILNFKPHRKVKT